MPLPGFLIHCDRNSVTTAGLRKLLKYSAAAVVLFGLTAHTPARADTVDVINAVASITSTLQQQLADVVKNGDAISNDPKNIDTIKLLRGSLDIMLQIASLLPSLKTLSDVGQLSVDVFNVGEKIKQINDLYKEKKYDELRVSVGELVTASGKLALDITIVTTKTVGGTLAPVPIALADALVASADAIIDDIGNDKRDEANEQANSIVAFKRMVLGRLQERMNSYKELIENGAKLDSNILSREEIRQEIEGILRQGLRKLNEEPFSKSSPDNDHWYDNFYTDNSDTKLWISTRDLFNSILNGTNSKYSVDSIVGDLVNYQDAVQRDKIREEAFKLVAKSEALAPKDDTRGPVPPQQPPPTVPPQESPTVPPQVPPVTPPVVIPTPKPPTPPVVVSKYEYSGIFAAKLVGAQSFVGFGVSLSAAYDPLVTDTTPKKFTLNVEPGANFSSYFNSDRGIAPQITPVAIWMDKSARSEGTVIGSTAVSNQTYNYLYFGEYVGSESEPVTVTGDNYSRKVARAWWLLGQATPAASVPQGGKATYQGGVNGIATNGEEISGRLNFDVNFSNHSMSGWMHLRRADTTRWGLATFSNITINGGRFNAGGTFQSYLAVPRPGGTVSPGEISMFGSFVGPSAQEMGGGWSLWNTNDALMGAAGIFRAKSGFASETAPAPPQTQTPGTVIGDNSGFLGGRRSDGMLFTTDLVDFGATAKTGTIAQVPGCCSSSTIAQSVVTPTVNAASLGSYQYVAWGDWNGDIQRVPADASPVSASGKWVYGRTTKFDEVPKTGSATYRGEISGVASNGERIGGDIALLARFSNQTLWNAPDIEWQGNFRRANGTSWLTVAESPVPFTNGAFGSTWGGFAKSPTGESLLNVFGHIYGRLYGTQGQEIAGTWSVQNVPGDISYANGVFRAKK